jgi:signal transduction histidine kinase
MSASIRNAIAHGTPWDLELPFVTGAGRSIWVRTFGEVESESGTPVRLVGALQDVTEQHNRRTELQREQANRREIERHAQALDRLLHERNEMLDVLAHEVRQPLHNASASLQSAAAVLADFGEKVASRRLTRAQTVMGQVMGSIDNTLAVASLLARPGPIQRELTDIDTLLDIAIADMPEGDRGRIRVEHEADIRSASMDMSLMRLAVRNLLSNALRFSPLDSPVVIRVTDRDDPPALCIDVVDAGGGIPDDKLTGLFQRVVRPRRDDPMASRGPGLGLGLYIVRRVMELHGGRAELAANTAEGVTMRLVIVDLVED